MKRKRWLCLCICLTLLVLCLGAGAAEAEAEETAMVKPTLVAHAGGAIYGFRLTNSLEALNSAYDNGFRLLELDFCLTSDGVPVLLHDWESMAERLLFSTGRRSLADFQAAATFMDLTLLDAEGLLDWLEEHPDCRVITDVKEADNLAVLRDLWDRASARSAAPAEVFIPQIYLPADYEAVTALGYRDVILTLYRMPEWDPWRMGLFIRDHPLWALTIPLERLEEDLTQALGDSGVTVYTHALNTLSDYEYWHARGVYGGYTDYFQPLHWPGA